MLIDGLLAAIDGPQNLREVDPASSRLRIAVAGSSEVDTWALQRLGLRGSALVAPNCLHVIVGPAESATCTALRELLAPAAAN